MSEDWESMKLELQEVVGNHRAANEPYKNDLWKQHKGKIEKELADFLAMPAPKNASELQKRGEHKDRLIREWERTILIADAEFGTRGQGGVVRSLFTLNDAIQALDAGSTKLSKRMLWLTWAIAGMTLLMVADIGEKWFEVVSQRWTRKQPALERPEAKGKAPAEQSSSLHL